MFINIYDLIICTVNDEMNEISVYSLIAAMTKWSHPFAEYWTKTFHRRADNIGAWALSSFGLDRTTTNSSESFNCVMKRLQEWKEAPIDCIALSLLRLTQFYVNEVRRGRCGLGSYSLRPGLPSTAVWLPSTEAIYDPTVIVQNVRDAGTPPPSQPSTSAGATPPSQPSPVPSTSAGAPPPSQPSTSAGATPPSQPSPVPSTSSCERAMSVISAGKISLDSKLAIFTVMGTSEARVVQLFPVASCSCPAKSNCYHLKAAEMAVGLHRNETKRVINLTQLRKNKRKKADKTSGRKRPRTDDVDVIAAPDADDNADLVDILHPSQADVEPDDDSSSSRSLNKTFVTNVLLTFRPGDSVKI